MKDGREIAMSVNPNVSDDVCTFCVHAKFGDGSQILDAPTCVLGHDSYFRSLSNLGPIWVSDCKSGKLRPEFVPAAQSSRPNPGGEAK